VNPSLNALLAAVRTFPQSGPETNVAVVRPSWPKFVAKEGERRVRFLKPSPQPPPPVDCVAVVESPASINAELEDARLAVSERVGEADVARVRKESSRKKAATESNIFVDDEENV